MDDEGSEHGFPPILDREKLLTELRCLEWDVLLPSLCESIRLLESEAFGDLTDADVHDIANYRAVDVGRETFFERAFTPGKEAAASLAFARIIGRDTVLGDLNHLHASLGCPCDQRAAA
jgi:hypothetical protein